MARMITAPYQDTYSWTDDELDAEVRRLTRKLRLAAPQQRSWIERCRTTLLGDLDARHATAPQGE